MSFLRSIIEKPIFKYEITNKYNEIQYFAIFYIKYK